MEQKDDFSFDLVASDSASKARAGVLHTPHGIIETPIFMPVGTAAAVKGVHFRELTEEVNAQIILSNTYHLFLRPGTEIIEQAGGLHKFMNWSGPILTDSGGYQVYSLSSIRKLSEEGVKFKSHIDGSDQFLSPEKAITVQRRLGADIIMAFDECTPYPCEYAYAKQSMHLTHRWLDRCWAEMEQYRDGGPYGSQQCLAPIVQGSVYSDLRKRSAEYIASKEAKINAIGGLSVGEPAEDMYLMTDEVTDILPIDKPRYLMGVGKPENILACIERGIDMFDCVLPSRNARHGLLYTSQGIINIKNQKWATEFSPIDVAIPASTSRVHTKAYLRHLFVSKELLGGQLATIQNLSFFLWLVKQARQAILDGRYVAWKKDVLPIITRRL